MEDITSLVVSTLYNKLPDIPIYRENMPTAFSEPSFFVSRISTSVIGEPNGYDIRNYAFDVAYFPEPTRPNEDADNMAEWLMANLKVIGADYASTFNQDLNLTDGVLHFTFNLRVRVREDFGPLMSGTLDYNGGLKNG